MITFTDTAKERVLALVEDVENSCLRLTHIGGSPLAPEFDLSLVEEASRTPEDTAVDGGGFLVLVDPESAARIDGLTVDFVLRNGQSGFEIRPPAPEPGSAPTGPLAERVQRVIDERINPGIAAHGGEIVLRDVRDDAILIEMRGGCQGCAMSRMTLRQGVERMIREAVPEIASVHDVTDHAGGENPYYR